MNTIIVIIQTFEHRLVTLMIKDTLFINAKVLDILHHRQLSCLLITNSIDLDKTVFIKASLASQTKLIQIWKLFPDIMA